MGVAVHLIRYAGNIKPRLGQYCFDRFNRDVGRVVWRGHVGVTSGQGEVRSPVPDLFTMQLIAGIVQPTGELIPLEQRKPQLFIVEPVDLPVGLRSKDLNKDLLLTVFSSDLIRAPQSGGTYQWIGGVNLVQTEVVSREREELLQGVEISGPFGRGRTVSETMLVNLTEGNGAPRDEMSLRQQIQELQYMLIRLGRA